MQRVRQNPRIRPVRPYWSRTKILTIAGLITLALLLMGTAWLQRTDERTVSLGPSGPYRVRSTTGPIEVTQADRPEVGYRSSWLIKGPTASLEANDLVLRCSTRFPCRAAAVVGLPLGGEQHQIELSTEDDDLVVNDFTGRLTAATTGDGDIVLGPISGSAVATTEEGSVFGYGLQLRQIDVETETGPVELDFLNRPERVSVQSGPEPVRITLPPGDYAVTVSGSDIAINVGQAADADSQITVHARGPVRIDPAE